MLFWSPACGWWHWQAVCWNPETRSFQEGGQFSPSLSCCFSAVARSYQELCQMLMGVLLIRIDTRSFQECYCLAVCLLAEKQCWRCHCLRPWIQSHPLCGRKLCWQAPAVCCPGLGGDHWWWLSDQRHHAVGPCCSPVCLPVVGRWW